MTESLLRPQACRGKRCAVKSNMLFDEACLPWALNQGRHLARSRLSESIDHAMNVRTDGPNCSPPGIAALPCWNPTRAVVKLWPWRDPLPFCMRFCHLQSL